MVQERNFMDKHQPGKYWIGFDLGGTKMLATVYDKDLQPLGSKRRRTRGRDNTGVESNRISQTIEKALADADIDLKNVQGIGVGCPGPIDPEKGVVYEAPNLGWQDVPLRKTLEKQFGCPAVLANDVDAGVYGEYRFGAGQSARCVLGVFPGTGIGGGCVYDGKIFRGRDKSCMEIGHVPVMPDGPLCGCGQRGCLEAVAGRLAISAATAQAAYRGAAPHLLREAGTDLADIRSGALAESIEAGDRAVEKIVRAAAAHIGTAIAGVVHLLAPDVVVLGGGLVEAMPKLFVGAVETAAREHLLPSFAVSLKVVPATLGDDSTVLGAAAWAEHVISTAC